MDKWQAIETIGIVIGIAALILAIISIGMNLETGKDIAEIKNMTEDIHEVVVEEYIDYIWIMIVIIIVIVVILIVKGLKRIMKYNQKGGRRMNWWKKLNRQQKANAFRGISGIFLVCLGFFFLEIFKNFNDILAQGVFIALWVAGIILLIEGTIGIWEHDI